MNKLTIVLFISFLICLTALTYMGQEKILSPEWSTGLLLLSFLVFGIGIVIAITRSEEEI